MTKFTGTFVHLVELTYEVEIEAESKEEAEEKIYDDPFTYVTTKNLEPIDEQGLDVTDIELQRELGE